MMLHHSTQSQTDSNIHRNINNNTMSSTQSEYNPSEIYNQQKWRIESEINQLNNRATHARHSRSTEENRLDQQASQIEHLHHSESGYHLTNDQILIPDAIKFLNTHDPNDHKWSDFEKNPIKSLLLWYANAGCFAFDEYKEYSMSSNGKQIDTETLKNEIAEESLSDQELANLIKNFTNAIHTQMEICMPVHVAVSDS